MIFSTTVGGDAYHHHGAGLYALAMHDLRREDGKSALEKMESAVEEFEAGLKIDPGNKQIRDMLRLVNGQAAKLRAHLPGDQHGSSGGCWIAAAACGQDAHEVSRLRAFRDGVLTQSKLGRTFIWFYGLTGPTIATVVRRSRCLRTLTRALIVVPAAHVITWLRRP